MRSVRYLLRYLQSLHNPGKTQEKVLRSILRKNRYTVYGKKYGFHTIRSSAEYQERVPLVTYSDISPYMQRMTSGEKHVLTSFDVVHFCATSGTSGTKKFLPVTSERIQALRTELYVRGLRARKIFKGNWKVIFGPILYICGSYQEGFTESGIPYGSISGFLGKHAPKISRDKYAIPIEVFKELDYDKKLSEMAYYALLADLKHLGFTTTIEVLLIFDYIEEHAEELLQRIEQTHPRRARYLRRLPSMTPKYIWPNIKLANCFLTETTKAYMKVLEERLDRPIHMRDAGINSSEGRITLGVCEDDISGLPVAFNTFFEFIDQEDSQRILTLEQVEVGKTYEVVMTTYEGLYRYRTGDILEVTYFENRLPAFKFRMRTSYLDIVGELSPEEDLITAFHELIDEHGYAVEGFAYIPWIPQGEGKPRYELLVEPAPDQPIAESDWRALAHKLDLLLQKRIHDYYQMRKIFGRMDELIISLLKPGSWKSFNLNRLVTVGQPKHIHVVCDAAFRQHFTIEKTLI